VKNKINVELLKSILDELGLSRASISRYIRENGCPSHLCNEIEIKSEGEITCNLLRPDIFKATPAQVSLSDQCIKNFDSHIQSDNYQLIIAILNFLESQQPRLYEETIAQIMNLGETGETFVKQRLAHQRNERNR